MSKLLEPGHTYGTPSISDEDRLDNINRNTAAGIGAAAAVVGDVGTTIDGAFSLAAFWGDMRFRERSWAHQAVLLLGLLQVALACAYAGVLYDRHVACSFEDAACVNQFTVIAAIAGVAQGILLINGICLENAAMLAVANANGAALLARLIIASTHGLVSAAADITITSCFGALCALQVLLSTIAWGGGFNRFLVYRIGSMPEHQAPYRWYELLSALLLADATLVLLIGASIVVLSTGAWWQFMLVALVMAAAVIAQGAVRFAVRRELSAVLLVALAVQAVAVVLAPVAVFAHDTVRVRLYTQCRPAVLFYGAIFIATHVASAVVALRMRHHFGEGMREVFRRERTAVAFVNEQARRRQELQNRLLNIY